MVHVKLEINGRAVAHDAPPRMHLGDFIRDQARLTGTHLGCEHGVCGACTVLVDGEPVRSCITFAVACEGRHVTTIEGYDHDPVMTRLRAAFTQFHALQCGYCTPGMLATARDIVLRLPDADEAQVRVELSGNLCRCTGYMGIVQAILFVLQSCRDTPDEEIETLRRDMAAGRAQAPARSESPVVFKTFKASGQTHAANAAVDAASPDVAQSALAEPAGDASERRSAHDAEGEGADAPAAPASGKKDNAIEGVFVVPFPIDAVWAYMVDLPAVAACLPGAVIEEQDGDRIKGKIAIKFGPMAAAFKGSAKLDRDDAAYRALFRGAGQDTLSQSRAKGDITYSLSSVENGTRVDVSLLYALQGPLAQFSRSGLVQDFVRRMIADFGKNVTARMGAAQAGTEPPPLAKFNPVTLFLGVIWQRILRWFGRKT